MIIENQLLDPDDDGAGEKDEGSNLSSSRPSPENHPPNDGDRGNSPDASNEPKQDFPTSHLEDEMSRNFSDKLLTTPTFPEEIFKDLPTLLRDSCMQFEHPRERDLFLTGALTVLSGCIKSVCGTYNQSTVYPNLFCFIVAPPASGKGAFNFAKDLGMAIHLSMRERNQMNADLYELEKAKFRVLSAESASGNMAPIKPDFHSLYIPANTSSASMIDLLVKCKGHGIIFESEADSMSNSFKQDWGGYSDMLRKSFHHETISYSRKINNEFKEIHTPRISVALSGTPSQVKGLIPSADDGLFSRFIYYVFRVLPEWKDVSPNGKVNLSEYFAIQGQIVEQLACYLEAYPTEFFLSEFQWHVLNKKFDRWLKEISIFVNEDAISTVKRHGLITFRIAMILSAIRKYEEGVQDSAIICEDTDFETAISLTEVYMQHAILMFCELPKSKESTLDQNKRRFFDALPSGKPFSRQEAVKVGETMGLKARTIDKYLHQLLGPFLEQTIKNGPYRKKL